MSRVTASFLAPMEARTADSLPEGDGWQFEPKCDGFRCIAIRTDGDVDLRAKSGKPLGRYFPEVIASIKTVKGGDFVIDGELVVAVNGGLSFDALQMRLHPAASRIRKLSVESPAKLILFDILSQRQTSFVHLPLLERRAKLTRFMQTAAVTDALEMSPATTDRARALRWLRSTETGSTDGVIAKRLDGLYQSGVRAMVKIKRLRTADCVVGGFRYESARKMVGSLLLGLYDDEKLLHHVGFTSAIAKEERAALTKKLEALREAPGFTGDAPGGPSRWSNARSAEWVPLKPELVVEVRYDHVTNSRFRHGTKPVRWRPDKAPRQCTFEQIA